MGFTNIPATIIKATGVRITVPLPEATGNINITHKPATASYLYESNAFNQELLNMLAV